MAKNAGEIKTVSPAFFYSALTQIRSTYSQDAVSLTAMEGCKYKSSKDIGGKDFRLMLVDRAVNG